MTIGNNAQLRFADNAGNVNAGIVVDASNVMHYYSTTTAGASLDLFNMPLDNSQARMTLGRSTVLTSSVNSWTGALTPIWQGSNNATGTITSGQANVYVFNINSDTLNTTNAGGPGGATNLFVGDTVGNNYSGNRNGIQAFLNITGTSGNPTSHATLFYTALVGDARAQAAANVSGTNQALFGALIDTRLKNGATGNWGQTGIEIDVTAESGSAAINKVGLNIVQEATSVVNASLSNDAIAIDSQVGSTAQWTNGITFGQRNGIWGINTSTGTLIAAEGTALGGPAYQADYGINWTGVTFNTAFLASANFLVDGTGNTDVKSLTLLAGKDVATLGTCAGANEGQMWAVTNSGTATYNANVLPSGPNHVIAYCNGSNWVAH